MKTAARISVFTGMLLGSCLTMSADRFEVASPSGDIALTVESDSQGAVTYEVSRGGVRIIESSPLGITLGTASLDRFPRSVEATYDSADETFTLPHGKKSVFRNHFNGMTLDCKGQGGKNLTIIFRVYDDAVAFRYALSNRRGSQISGEQTGFNFSSMGNTWAMTYRKDYSWYYECRGWDELNDSEGYSMPMLLETASGYALLTEADNEATMAASRLVKGPQNCQLTLAHFAAGNIIDDNFLSPWRTVIIGDLNDIVGSTTLQALCPATLIDDMSWIRPGKMSWNWGAEDADNKPTMEQAKAYIDLAAYYGWEYFLLDDGWEGRLDPAEVAAYAAEKGVGLFLWAHQARFSADVETNMQWFSQWADAGVKGVKIDFFEDDSREMLAKYEGILEAAAQARLLVNFHGCTKPSGLERKWPHLMTSEAVLGGEFYMFNSTMTPASHGVNLVLTRNVLGSMDYTPVKYGNKKGRAIRNTTWSYQTALATAFESSLLCVCDCPANLVGHIAEPLLRSVPVTWDETRCLEAVPDKYVTLGRRKGDDWWVATLTAEARTAVIDLSFMPEGKEFGAYIYTEGIHRTDIGFEYREGLTSEAKIELQLGENSGATVILSENRSMVAPAVIRREAENYNMRGSRKADADCSGGFYIGELNNSKKYLNFNDIEVDRGGDYYLTLYYLDNDDHQAYIQVNGGDKEYHMFNRPGSSINGRDMGFKTVKVHLEEGLNTIVYGNDNGVAPAIDRITVTGFGVPRQASVPCVAAESDELFSWRFAAGGIMVTLPDDSAIYLFDTDGHLLYGRALKAGEHMVEVPIGMPVIANVVCGSYSRSIKIVSDR
ncbi:MAG: glycoside hydrolase family 97 catalytic domain-containing protein [Muribaculaceae bacterium]|nr:glycoside hydrolase family 97 catalytic domain-containing protein [Muribaculaceae bacterium]